MLELAAYSIVSLGELIKKDGIICQKLNAHGLAELMVQ